MLIFIIIFSCDENPIFIDCNDCFDTEPEYATLLIRLDNNLSGGFSPPAIVRIYEGNLEDNILRYEYYVNGNKWEVDVALNKKYTITATYTDSKGIRYVAVDTAYPRLKYEKSQCDNPCYYIYDRVVNLVIKYRQ